MKITKEYLKQLIREQIKEQEDIADALAATEAGSETDKSDASKEEMNSQELKAKIHNMAKSVSGIMRNEIDIVEFALAILDSAKAKNLNSGILRKKLELVKDEIARIK